MRMHMCAFAAALGPCPPGRCTATPSGVPWTSPRSSRASRTLWPSARLVRPRPLSMAALHCDLAQVMHAAVLHACDFSSFSDPRVIPIGAHMRARYRRSASQYSVAPLTCTHTPVSRRPPGCNCCQNPVGDYYEPAGQAKASLEYLVRMAHQYVSTLSRTRGCMPPTHLRAAQVRVYAKKLAHTDATVNAVIPVRGCGQCRAAGPASHASMLHQLHYQTFT